jgi:hypothetical protein
MESLSAVANGWAFAAAVALIDPEERPAAAVLIDPQVCHQRRRLL